MNYTQKVRLELEDYVFKTCIILPLGMMCIFNTRWIIQIIGVLLFLYHAVVHQ